MSRDEFSESADQVIDRLERLAHTGSSEAALMATTHLIEIGGDGQLTPEQAKRAVDAIMRVD